MSGGPDRPPQPPGGRSPEDEALLAALAGRVVRHRMETPAILFLESVRPLNFVGSQALVFLQPLLSSLFRWEQYERFTQLMADRDNVDRLVRSIERQAEARDAAERAARAERKRRP